MHCPHRQASSGPFQGPWACFSDSQRWQLFISFGMSVVVVFLASVVLEFILQSNKIFYLFIFFK